MKEFENLTIRQRKCLDEFVKEAIYFTEEENAAIEHQIPMTQELFEQCVRHCVEIGAYIRLTCLLNEYLNFADEYAKKIEEEIVDIKISESALERFKKRFMETMNKKSIE